MRKKEQEDKDRESLDHDIAQDNPMDPPTSTSDMIIEVHIPFTELGLVPFTPSKHHVVASLDTIFFDKNKKNIFRRSKRRLNIGDQTDAITVTEKTVM